MSNQALRSLLAVLVAEERQLVQEGSAESYKLRVLRGKLDILRAELVSRRRGTEGDDAPGA